MARRCGLLLTAIAAIATAAGDPFIGAWRLNHARSSIKGNVVRIQVARDGLYRFITGGDIEISCTMDGRDRRTPTGLVMNCRQLSERTYVTTVRDGKRVRSSATWQLAPNGRSMIVVNHIYRPDGQERDDRAFVERLSGGAGLAGEWQSTKILESVPERFEILPFGAEGHAILSPAQKTTLRIRYDGQAYTMRGPLVAEGAMVTGRRPDPRRIELTEAARGKLLGRSTMVVSEDGRILTQIYDSPYTDGPATFVYEREAPQGASRRPRR